MPGPSANFPTSTSSTALTTFRFKKIIACAFDQRSALEQELYQIKKGLMERSIRYIGTRERKVQDSKDVNAADGCLFSGQLMHGPGIGATPTLEFSGAIPRALAGLDRAPLPNNPRRGFPICPNTGSTPCSRSSLGKMLHKNPACSITATCFLAWCQTTSLMIDGILYIMDFLSGRVILGATIRSHSGPVHEAKIQVRHEGRRSFLR